ncbi:sugar MFS transporter [Colwellia sp. 1_MG-2023]|uniref:sugar MFS transporter n=1 Tax=unclassified Colwellia TaxID=196834 RepID=UPI001C08EDD1|nr:MULTISPECIES: sugar MFS transporter [unclassified Colwellia]MBU2926178.1 sugar MFS transporter [Colwellia sp. C2M11]MDO6652401.1 sugar MFS transporter [Colwellia sp. 3_MG-2023]MDO6665724.1 sugar MFS transporter [Colwellia sp. 2_MG-2023]MDO6690097.1 sugar MFS transporter [Colwellia sp. 1_MG-2023]
MASSAVIIDTQNSSENSSSNPPQNSMFALVSLTSLFFMWGFITCLNDILIPYLKGMFDLSYTQAMLIQFCFFGAYFIVSLPAGALVSRLGYKKGIVTGLSIASLGCLLFYPAAEIGVYAVFLLALFVLATGITILQVSANPYVSALGPSKTASSRLTLTQAFNSFGTTVAPFFGAWLIFSGVESSEAVDASSVQIPYIAIALTLMVLAGIFALLKLPNLGQNAQAQISPSKAWQFKHLRLGAVGIFVYVGAEVAIGSFLINFLAEPTIAGITEAEAAKYISYYWGGAMVGRFIGAGVMQLVSANKVLFINAVCAAILVFVAMVTDGSIAMLAILAVGFFNSIMFPTIFTLAINQLGNAASHGAGVLCLAIVGGAILPLVQGALADALGIQLSFILPIFCYAYIVYYALIGSKPDVTTIQFQEGGKHEAI